MNSTNSQTNIFNSKDFKKYITNMEENITKVSNYYNYLIEKYDKKINNIVNRYEGRTNKLYIDLRRREGDYMKLNKKIDNIINKTDNNCYIDIKDIDYTYRIISLFLYMYTLFVIIMVISYFY
jgi:hypothetical protein